MRLTTKAIQALKPTNQRQELKDDGARGLYLLVQASGAKGWAVRYHLDGKVRKVTLGTFPQMSLAAAREAARRVFEQLASNVDPREKQPLPFGRYIQMLLLTACRRTDLATLEWRDVDLYEQTIVIPPERYKNGKAHLIPLSRHAMALLQEQPRIGERWVFTATGRKPLNAYEKRMEWFRALLDPPIDFSLHDLRRTVRTNMSRLRVPPHIAERVLGHSLRGVERHYDFHSYADEKRLALQIWADHIDAVVSGQRGSVTPLLPRTMIAAG